MEDTLWDSPFFLLRQILVSLIEANGNQAVYYCSNDNRRHYSMQKNRHPNDDDEAKHAEETKYPTCNINKANLLHLHQFICHAMFPYG